MLIALAAVIVLAQAAPPPPPAQAPQAAAAPAAEAAKPAKPPKPKPKMICHDEVATGSVISHQVCRSREQLDADSQQAKRDNEALMDHLAACHGAAC